MKRMKAASITQTIVFTRNEDESQEYARRKLQEEIERYKCRLNRENTVIKLNNY